MGSGRLDSPWARIDRERSLTFSFDGQELKAHPGDTLASALLANGVDVVGRSTYLDRPRGLLAAGSEEPNALVELQLPTHVEPLARATTVEVFDGLVARARAGRGRAVVPGEPPRCDKRNLHCDLLVIGAGPAGLAAAAAAAAAGTRVLLVDDRAQLGGATLPSAASEQQARDDAAALDHASEAQVLTRTTAIGLFDQGYAVLRQCLPAPAPVGSERLWHVRARRVILATGAIERPLVFADNDRPGIMLAHAAATYAARFGVRPGRRVVVFTVDDSAYEAADQLVAAGVDVVALCDGRAETPREPTERLTGRGVEVIAGAAVAATEGADRLESVSVVPLDGAGQSAGPPRQIDCDQLAVCGGWSPALHLWAQVGGKVSWDPELAMHVPVGRHPYAAVVGTAAGSDLPLVPTRALWSVPPLPGSNWERHFVDLQRDATVADVRRAVLAGLRSPEHVKRYTTIGTGEDQGKTANVNLLGLLAGETETPLDQLSATTYRPPFVPLPFAVLAGRDRGFLHDPVRTTPLHSRHLALGAVFEDVGQWKRARYYPVGDEDMAAAVRRECAATRSSAGLMDASTLGKIDVQGPDAAEFLDRVYTNQMSTLAVGMCRYGVLCRADGMVFDDGVVMRPAPDRYLTTTTTGGAATVLDWLEELLQTEWPDLRVHLTSVTDHWATIAVVGPASREIVATLASGVSIANEDFPFMSIREARVAGAPVRLCRVSFSGELAFEIHTPARYGPKVWDAVYDAGRPHDIVPYGTETMHVLRAEKGYVIVGQDTDGTVTPQDAAMEWIVSKKKDFFVGRRSQHRPDIVRADRRQLIALLPEDPEASVPEGAQLLSDDGRETAGHVTSSYFSPALNRNFALALLAGGQARKGEVVEVAFGEHRVAARVSETVLYDPEGSRRDGEPA